MSFGSYQQFCEQQRHALAAAAGRGAGDAGLGFDIHLPTSYPAVSSTSSPGLAATDFYGAVPGAGMQPLHAHQLPSSFFTSHDPGSRQFSGKRPLI